MKPPGIVAAFNSGTQLTNGEKLNDVLRVSLFSPNQAPARHRAGVLSVELILDRLEDRFLLLAHRDRAGPARHHTLRAAIGRSFELRTELERTM